MNVKFIIQGTKDIEGEYDEKILVEQYRLRIHAQAALVKAYPKKQIEIEQKIADLKNQLDVYYQEHHSIYLTHHRTKQCNPIKEFDEWMSKLPPHPITTKKVSFIKRLTSKQKANGFLNNETRNKVATILEAECKRLKTEYNLKNKDEKLNKKITQTQKDIAQQRRQDIKALIRELHTIDDKEILSDKLDALKNKMNSTRRFSKYSPIPIPTPMLSFFVKGRSEIDKAIKVLKDSKEPEDKKNNNPQYKP